MWRMVKMLWPLWVFCALVIFIEIVVILFKRLANERRIRNQFNAGSRWLSDQELLYWLRGMKPWEFEEYIAELFNKLGFKARKVGGGYDRGVDVVAEKDGREHYIQCKKYFPKHQVVPADVREFYGAIADHLANGKAYFITTSTFTLEAEKFVEGKPMELWDGYRLTEYIHLAEKNKKAD